MKRFWLFGLALAGAVALADAPFVDWVQHPVKPGEHVLLQGGNWGTNAVVEIGGRKLKPDFVSGSGLVFAYPSGREEVLKGRIVSDGGRSNEFSVNEPTVWWTQGDGGDISTPGGWLRVFGHSLAGGRVRIKGTGFLARWRELELSRVDEYELAAKVPVDLKPGEYRVEARSAIGGWTDAGRWTVAAPCRIGGSRIFDISDFGAIPDDGLDDSEAFTNALASAGRAGGGVVSIPRGLFNVKGTFEIPTNTLIRGVSRSLSHLKWPDLLDPPEFMLVGEHTFGIHDLFISVGQYRNGVGYKGGISKSFWASDKPRTHDISLKRLTLRFVTDQQRDRDKKVFMERFTMKGIPIYLPDALRVEMDEVDLYCDKCPTDSKYFMLTGWYHRIANCSFRGGAWCPAPGIRFIFEDNEIEKGCISINPMCDGAYYARNRFRDVYRGDPVCLGHDSSRTAFGRCKPVRGEVVPGDDRRVRLTFEDPKDNPANKAKSGKRTACEAKNTWIGASCTIVSGHGAGQSRKIAAIADDWSELTLEEPFGVAPDRTSFLYVSVERRHVLMIDNVFTDAGRGVELYGGANEYIIARNRSIRAGGLKAQGFVYSGVIPCWRIQFLDNVIEEGSGERSDSEILACGAYSLGCVAKRNVLKSNAAVNFSCADGLVEANDIRNCDFGVKASGGTYVGSNAYENVAAPLVAAGGAVWGDAAKAAHARWQRDLAARIRANAGKPMGEAEFKKLFDARVSFSINRKTIREILAGRTWPKGLALPVSFGYNPMVPEIASVEMSAEGAGGWSYGKPVKMSFQKGRPGKLEASFYGCLQAKTSGEKTGYFTVPLRLRITGKDGWTLETVVTTPIASTGYENLVPEWRYAIVKGAELPKDMNTLQWIKVDRFAENGGVDCTWMDCAKDPEFFGNYTDSLVFESRFEVRKPVCIGFCRDDIPGVFSLDGEILHRGGAWHNVYVTRTVQPGVHVIRNFRPRGGWMMWARSKAMRAFFSHPKGANPGDYVFLPAEEDFSSFRRADFAPSVPLKAFANPEFEDRTAFGKVDKHLTIGPSYGFNGTAGARLWAWQKVLYYPFRTAFRLEPGKKYRFSYMGKSHAWGATTVEWELVRNGRKIDAALGPTSTDLGGGWVKRELVIAPKVPQQEGDESRILIIATQRGRESVSDQAENYIDIDNFTLREDVPDWYVAHAWPTHNKVYNDNGRVRLCSFFKGAYVPKDADPVYEVKLLDKAGETIVSRRIEHVREGAFTVPFGKLAYAGEAKLAVTLYDRKNRLNAGTREIEVSVTPTFRPGRNEIHVDENGVSWLNGKRFMPLGFYAKFADRTLYPDLEAELRKFSAMGFNCVIDYKTELLKTKADRDRYYGLMDKYGIKVFPVDFMGDGCATEAQWAERASGVEARAKELAKYPAVLGWYTLDEAGEDKIPLLVRTRRALNRVSPGKVTLPCNILDPEPFACVGDVQSGDIYPIGKSPDLMDMDRYTSRAAACRPAASWQAPQMYNWITQNRAAVTNEAIWRAGGREPTENEALSVALLFAAHGVNGFVFYSWYDIPRCPIPSVVDERWRIAAALAKELKALEPYITSGVALEPVAHTDAKGSHRIVALTDPKGRKAVLVVGLEGDNEAKFSLPKEFGQLKSQCGKAVCENGKWTFKGKEFSCDILR